VVDNVHEYPGHIACDAASKSEIVLPLRDRAGRLIGVLENGSSPLASIPSYASISGCPIPPWLWREVYLFFSGMLSDKVGPLNTIRLGTLLYGVGLLLRVIPNSAIVSIISGFVAGLGASSVMVCSRTWILSWCNDNERPAAISLSSMGVNIGTAAGTSLAGAALSILSGTSYSYPIILIIASGVVLMTALLIPSKIKSTPSAAESLKKNDATFWMVLKEHRLLPDDGGASILNSALQVLRRKKLYADYGGDHQTFIRSSGQEMPSIVVVIHNYSAFAETYENLEEAVAYLVREGLKYGVYFDISEFITFRVKFRLHPFRFFW
jgi:MFS family permease